MKTRAIFTFAMLLFCVFAPAYAVDTRDIELVRSKKILDDADLAIIDKFVEQAVGELLATVDFTSISTIRSIIIANSSSNQPGQVQYARQFSESAEKYLSEAMQTADTLTPPSRSFRMETNLLILISDLSDTRLVDISLRYVDSENSVIRYWAVHSLANPRIIEKLKEAQQLDTVRRILGSFDPIVNTSSMETLGLIAVFAGSMEAPGADGLLFKVADRRIASYADWSVEYELLDAGVLQMLSEKIASQNPDRAEAARRFGQLFSYLMQRYIKGVMILTAAEKEQIASVLAETERSCLNKLTGQTRSGIRKAIESNDIDALLAEHDNLLGNMTKKGELSERLNFDYGKDANGTAMTYPLQLASPPATLSLDLPETEEISE